jgi:hypothetical protein
MVDGGGLVGTFVPNRAARGGRTQYRQWSMVNVNDNDNDTIYDKVEMDRVRHDWGREGLDGGELSMGLLSMIECFCAKVFLSHLR